MIDEKEEKEAKVFLALFENASEEAQERAVHLLKGGQLTREETEQMKLNIMKRAMRDIQLIESVTQEE